MASITTKYAVGDKVWACGTQYAQTSVICPSCLGKKVWMITFGDGHQEECQCQTCKLGYSNPSGRLYFSEWTKKVVMLTIGMVRFEDVPKYMCKETGIGSGKLYRETDLFSDKEDAEKFAEIKYEEQMAMLAENNFKKKNSFAERLSTLGYTKGAAFEEERCLRKWIDLINKGSKHA